MSFSIRELAERIEGTVRGDDSKRVADVASLASARPDQISYLDSQKQLGTLKNSAAGAIITTSDLATNVAEDIPLILVAAPQKAFIDAMLLFRPARPQPEVGISAQAIVSTSARFGSDCRVAAGAIIGNDVVIGDRCTISHGVVIGDGTRIGDDCIIYPNAVTYADVQIRNRVIIHANAVIGGDGFGYRFVKGAFVKIPHTGTVILEDDVEIGACATIDRGMIEATVIGQGTKIDNHVMIAHNCQIGRHNALASQVGLAGSVTTGDYVQMGGQVGIADHIAIGSQVKLGGGAGVLADIPKAGTYYDAPAIPEIDALKNHLNIRRLPEMRDQIKKLTQQVAALQAELQELASESRNTVA